MAIPDFQTMMLPTLNIVSKKQVSTSKDVISALVLEFRLTPDEQAQMLPSGTQRVIDNRAYWSLVYLAKAGLITRPGRGRYQISVIGAKVLAEKPTKIDINYLKQFEGFQKFREASKGDREETQVESFPDLNPVDPVEQLEASYLKLKQEVCTELLLHVHQLTPTDFELLVIELLKRMGYGVPGIESVTHRGGTGDGGIDGEISEDKLGLDMIYIQAKKYTDNSVGRPAVQQFVGSLNERKAKKGVFITTSNFTKEALEYVQRIDVRIALIDGQRLAELMYQHDLGVAPEQRFEVKRIDSDYFAA
jgi:restriction system protein